MIFFRSSLIFSGITQMTRYPFCTPNKLNPIPVFPDVARRAIEGEEGRYVRRPGEIEQAGGRAMMLHQGHPFEVVVRGGGVGEEMVGFAFEDAQDALFLIGPHSGVDAESLQIAGERAEEGLAFATGAAKGPIGIGRVGDYLEEFTPGVQAACLVLL